MQYIDALWFNKYQAIEGLLLIDLYVGAPQRRKATKEAFLRGDIENPELDYPKLEGLKTETIKRDLLVLSDEISRNEQNTDLKQAYLQLIEEKLLHLELVEATRNRDDETFKEKTEQAFGKPRVELLNRITPHVQSMLAQAKKAGAPSTSIQVIEGAVAKFNADYDNAIAPTFYPKEEETADADAIYRRFSVALQEYGITGWGILIDEDSSNAFVNINPGRKEIRIPRTRKISTQHLEALVAHEIGVHARRNQNAQAINFQLLTIGLDHYLKGDEGLSKYEETNVFPQSLNSTVEIYLGISLIYGLEGTPLGFREIFELFKHYHIVSNFDRQLSDDEANNYGWTRAEKFFRGTTGLSKGICFTKDLIYLEGYLGILEVLKTHPEEESRFFVGKYDPANETHRDILDQLEIHDNV